MSYISGLTFQYGGGFDSIIKLFDFSHIDNESIWVVDCLWVDGPMGETYQEMNNRAYSRHELLHRLTFGDNNFINFVRVREYDNSDEIGQISTPEDFIESNCRLIILVVDAFFYEVYGKSADVLNSIKSNLSSQLAIDATVIPEGELTRVSLWV